MRELLSSWGSVFLGRWRVSKEGVTWFRYWVVFWLVVRGGAREEGLGLDQSRYLLFLVGTTPVTFCSAVLEDPDPWVVWGDGSLVWRVYPEVFVPLNLPDYRWFVDVWTSRPTPWVHGLESHYGSPILRSRVEKVVLVQFSTEDLSSTEFLYSFIGFIMTRVSF